MLQKRRDMEKEFEKCFGCKVETKEHKGNLPLPISEKVLWAENQRTVML